MMESNSLEKTEHELSLNEQIDQLRRFGEVWPLRTVAVVCTLIMIGALYAFTVSSHEQIKVLLLFVAGVSGLVAIAISTQLPRWKRAIRATRTGRRVQGLLKLTVDRSDSENVVIMGEMRDGLAIWKLHFGSPLGWTPQSGEWPCEMVMLSEETIPALVELKRGLLIPNGRSHKVFSGSA